MVRHTIIATKSTSTSPVGFTAMSLIILLMADSFSAKNGASSLTLDPVVVQMSGPDGELSRAEARNAVAAANPIASVITPKTATGRISELIRYS
jgi:hypothetical protein